MNVVHAFYDRPHPQGSKRYVDVCMCVRETDRRPHKSSCKWPEPNWPGCGCPGLGHCFFAVEERGGGGGEPAGSRKCVLRAAINDSIECLMAPYKANTLSSRCTYSQECGEGGGWKGDNCFHCAL